MGQFNSAINRNPKLSPIDKFNYVPQGPWRAPAAHTIQGLTLSEANYAAAIELIKERFRRTQQIISAYIDELLKLPSCTDDNAIQIRSVYDRISVNVQGLMIKSLRIGSDQYGSFMIPIIMAKLSDAVDILIGSDYYLVAVIGDVTHGKGGPVAVRSKFGWLLSGPVRFTSAIELFQI